MSKTSDNVNLDFPARMADGRIFTDYRSNCLMNHILSQGKNSFEYRNFLINNGNKIEDEYMKKLNNDVKCNDCNAQTLLPLQSVQVCDSGVCVNQLKNPNGLGMGRANTQQQQ